MNLNYIDILSDYIDVLNLDKSSSQLKQREEFKSLDWFFDFTDIALPENWLVVNILDVTWIVTCGVAKKPNYIETGIPFLSAQNARPFKTNLNKVKFISEKDFKTFTVGAKPEKNDVLYTRVGNCGEAAKIPYDFDFAIYVSLTLIKPIHKLINSDYLVAFLNSTYGLSQANVGAIGTGLKNLNVNNVRKFKIPLPPLAEQNRIVDKLDRLFAQLETIKTSMANIPLLLKDFRQQVLTQAVTGKLTEEWRKGKRLEKWKFEEAKECCEKVQSGGTPKGSNFSPSGIPFLKVYNIVNNKIDFEYKPQYVAEEIQNSQIKKSITYPDDVIMNIVGPPLNKVAIIPNDYPEWNLNQAITLFRVKGYLLNNFLYYFFCEGSSVKSLVNETKGVVGQVNISLSQCREFQIPIPPIEEQQEIVRRVESLFDSAAAIEQQYKTLKDKIDTLPQAILHKAFKGELTEQLDSDGDAMELLEDIKALKGATGKVIKRNTNKNTAKKVKPYRETEEVLGMVAEEHYKK
jgi:type I restriction enzyme S subunit